MIAAITTDSILSALQAGEFCLQYQPIMSLSDECCVGAEALVRWRHKDGLIPAADFIPMVENTPMSGVLTYWIMDEAARELGLWLRQYDGIYLAINVPPEILGRGGVLYAATRSGLLEVADKLVFEITERGVPDKLGIDALNSALRDSALRDKRVRIALDDVHLEGAHLVTLSRIHGHIIIKVEAAAAIGDDRLEALATLMRIGIFNVVVETIETREQAVLFKNLGVPFGQGYYFSPPLFAADFLEYFRCHR